MTFTLKCAGLGVLKSGDGEEALIKLDAFQVHLVIVDLSLPVTEALAFIRQVRRRSRHLRTPLVMLASELQQGETAVAHSAGATESIVKPFTPHQLITVVTKVLASAPTEVAP